MNDRRAARTTDSRLDLLERDMVEVLNGVRAMRTRLDEFNGVMKALRIASLLVAIAVGLFTLMQVVRP